MGGITVEDLYNYLKVAAVAQRIGRIHSDEVYRSTSSSTGRLILMTKLPEEYQDAIDLQQKRVRFETHNVRQLALTKMKQVHSYRFGDCPKG